MAKMEAFTEMDWSAWAGCEGKAPTIGYIKFTDRDGEVMDATLIADDEGVHVYPFYEDEKDNGAYHFYHLSFGAKDNQRKANSVAGILPELVTFQQLLDLGFCSDND